MDELDCVVDVPTVRSSSSASSPDSPSDGVEGEAKGCGESYIDPTMFDEAAAKGKETQESKRRWQHVAVVEAH